MRVLWRQVMDSECAPCPADLRDCMTLLCFFSEEEAGFNVALSMESRHSLD